MLHLPKISADDKLSGLLNTYLDFLEQVIEPVAPKLSLRTLRFTHNAPAYPSAAGVFYHAHIVAAAFVKLHDCYTKAIAMLESAAAPEIMRESLRPFFARPDSVLEAIGSATPDDLYPPNDLLTLARTTARGLGLTSFRGGVVYKALAPDVAQQVDELLQAGPHLVEAANRAETAEDYAHLLRLVRKAGGFK